MYDFDPADIEEIGWDRFVSEAWEAIFVGYSRRGIRTIGRRWSDLIQGGLGCAQETADALVQYQVVDRQDRDLMTMRDPQQLLAAMEEVLADIGTDLANDPDLAESAGIDQADRERLVAAHARLARFVHDLDLGGDGEEDGEQ